MANRMKNLNEKPGSLKLYKLTRSCHGFSLIEAIIALAIVGLASTGALSLFASLAKERARNDFLTTANTARNQLYGLLETTDSWVATRDNSLALQCIHSIPVGICTGGTTVSPIILNSVGVPIFNPATQGFDTQGNICLITSPLCLIRYSIQTIIDCGIQPTCTSPAVVTTATMTVPVNPNNFPINSARYSFSIIHGSRAGKTPGYSKDCVNWAAMGWQSQSECLKDGRWHLVFANNSSGNPILGTVADLKIHVLDGAEVKITSVNPFILFGEICISAAIVVTSPGVIECLGAVRFSGTGGAGSVRVKTNGAVYCADLASPGADGCGVTVAVDWYVKY